VHSNKVPEYYGKNKAIFEKTGFLNGHDDFSQF
jgi:hypothetical protein